MALINATSFAGFLVLIYLSSFVLLAVIRIATGISIQRFGVSSIRHISYTYKDGIRIDIRGLGFAVHRPTFAQPTWISLRLQELVVTVDPDALQTSTAKQDGKTKTPPGNPESKPESATSSPRGVKDKSKLWRQLTNTKEHIKKIHDKIHWLRMLDIYATNTTLDVSGVGSLSVGSITLAIHTRRKMLDRGRLFRHKKDPSGGQKPAEWIFTTRSIFLCVSGREPIEVLDNMSINVHGLLYQEKSGLRDTSIAIKVGRLHIPVDDFLEFRLKSSRSPQPGLKRVPTSHHRDISLDDVVEELERPGSREAAIVQTVADSKEFLGSVLRGVQEIQLGMSFIRISKEVESLKKANLPVVMNIVIHEIGIDLHRVAQHSPSHRMYFSRNDIAHQALVAAVSISVSLDEDEVESSKIVYIPMATTTIRTTLPSKTMNFTEEHNALERNANVFFANLVVTSPSVDLTPQHLIQLLAIAQSQAKASPSAKHTHHRLISRLLPRAVVKFSIHEPVVRFVLPVAAKGHHEPDDFDMIISAVSGVSFEVESSHSAQEDLLYSLNSHLRVTTHTLYYQSASGVKHNLLQIDSLEIKAQVTASTEVFVVVSGALKSFSMLMVRDEVSQGVYNIVRHFHKKSYAEKVDPPKNKESFLRKLPPWLLEFHFEGTNCSFETAGVDSNISCQTRGAAFELESWTIDYVAHRADTTHKRSSRRKVSASVRPHELPENVTHLSPPASPARHHTVGQGPTDGRRLTAHVRGFQGFIIESIEEWEQKPFMSIPRTEVAFSTSHDHQGPTFHINSHTRAFYLDFSLYRAYSIGVAASVIQDAFQGPPSQRKSTPKDEQHNGVGEATLKLAVPKPGTVVELLAVDIKAGYVQIKANMPHDPAMMLQVYEVTAGRHRWSAPFVRSHLLRLHATSPHVRSAWARIVSMSSIRIDPRITRRKTAQGSVEERSVDVSTDFIRLGVPHGLQMFKVFDNFVNTSKALSQLLHRFKTRSNEYILKKGPERPKHVPRLSIRCKALMFELEDDAFEWRLSNIYHVGRNEQKQRIAREDAYKLKLQKMQEERGGRLPSRRRAQSSRPVSRDTSPMTPMRRSQSQERTPRRRSESRGRRRKTSRLRYDREGTCNLTSTASVQADEAWKKLQEYNSRSWKTRIDWLRNVQNNTIKNIRRMFSGADEPPPDVDDHETILGIPNRPGLLTIVISDLHLLVDKPSFHMNALPKFLNEVGKGMPYDMQYALLIPMSISLDMGEARFMLRDYPLNLLHVPAIRPGQPPRLPSWSMRTDFVIAEEFRDDKSIRHVEVEIIPKGQKTKDGDAIPGFAVDVRRTVSPVKTYSMPVIDINTSAPTSISWGTSYQPAIQDAMMIIESFTKPEIDPSDRVGFWDKIRLSFHSRPVINWKGDGDVQLRLKGSRDPYNVTGYGAGFVMCWRNNVRWAIHEDDDPKKFMTVTSGEFVLAIPDYSHKAQSSSDDSSYHDVDSMTSSSSMKNAAVFSKVIMKVSGNVQWRAGLVFERELPNGERSAEFTPHYDVVLRNPYFLSSKTLEDYDAFHGFRSSNIHMSISLAAPFDRDWTSPNVSPSQSYNSVHLTPRFFSHFFAWWSLFSGVMALPIRQGQLWHGLEKTSKKFGRHLATLKYGLFLSPLFIAHVYKHKDNEDYEKDVVSATGLKLRLDSFILDLHQRREWFNTLSRTKSEQLRTSAMKINRAELDFVNADLRAVAANISGTTAEDLKRATDEMLSAFSELVPNVDMSKFTIPDHDFSWIDMDDFVELEWILPAEANPETKILPLAFTPRFTYFRQTDHGNAIHGDESRESPFGQEDTHDCVIPSRHNDPRKTQMHLIRARLKNLEEQIVIHKKNMGDHELKIIRDGQQGTNVQEEMQMYQAQEKELTDKRTFLEHGLRRLAQREHPGEVSHVFGERFMNSREKNEDLDSPTRSPHRESIDSTQASAPSQASNGPVDMDGLYSAPHDEFASDFNNRFIIHNAQVKWNNSLRNIILRYSHQVSQRRGFVYYMSRRAVKFILDIVDEQAKRNGNQRQRNGTRPKTPPTPTVTSPTEDRDADNVIEDRIQQLLNDANRFVTANDTEESPQRPVRRASTISIDPEEKLADDFLAMNSYNMRLIAPQIQFQSEKNTTSVVLLTTKGMQLKVVSIMDRERLSDDVSGLVQRRFALDMDGVQIFVTSLKQMSKFIHLYSGNRYGNSPGSSWPPWASIETMFDFQIDPFGFRRVVQKTSASLRYEKYNALRLKYNEEVAEGTKSESRGSKGKESRIDHLWVDFPRLRASCDSQQYYTMYIIVLDLLMYHEPLEKTRSERLEKIMLTTDFSNLRGAPKMAENLQERIRQLSELKLHFILNARLLDKKGWQDRIDLEKDLASCEDELFFIMKAINTSQQRNDERSSQSSGFLRWYLSASQIVWHLMRDKNEPLLEFQLGNATYERIDNSDGSNHNAMEIEHIRGWNLLQNAVYPEIIGPYRDPQQKQITEVPKMLQLHWYMLEAIAGIPVLEEFQVTMHPLKVQLERSLGKALFEYIFPGIGSNAFDNGSFSPLMVKNMKPIEDDDDEENERAREIVSPPQNLTFPNHSEMTRSTPGAIGSRLQPTYNLARSSRPSTSTINASKNKGLGIGSHRIGLFGHHNRDQKDAKSDPSKDGLQRQLSSHSLSSFRMKSRDRDNSSVSLNQDVGKLARSDSREGRGLRLRRHDSSTDKEKRKSHDDVSQMVARASNYMTLAHVKLNSFVICLSYKGQRDRNLEDLHGFVFRMPPLEYRNKTWSNLDLALHLKKDVIRALISHTGAIIGNKFSHHRPGKKQVERLREIAAGNALIPNSETLVNTPSVSSDRSSIYTDSDHTPPRMSFQSDHHATDSGRRLEPSPLLTSGDWSNVTDPKQRGGMSVGKIGESASNSDQTLSTEPGKSDSRGSPETNDWAFSPASPSRIDPLGPIPSFLPRPSTASAFIPAKSLLKDVVGRRFSNLNSPDSNGANRPATQKTRVRFKGSNSFSSEKGSMERRFSQGSASTPENDAAHHRDRAGSAPDQSSPNSRVSESDTDIKDFNDESTGLPSAKRKAMMLLGKKVLNGFKG